LYERSTKIDAGPPEVIVLRSPGAAATIDPARGGRVASLVVGGEELLVEEVELIAGEVRRNPAVAGSTEEV
jgi:hypothetical protein